MTRRVVVTGVGAVTPCGPDARTTWESMVAARSGVGPITRFDATGWPTRIAAEVKGFDGDAVFGRREAKRMDRFTQLAIVAADEAVRSAGLEPGAMNPERLGVYLGTGVGGLEEIYAGYEGFRVEGWRGVSPFYIPKSLTNLAAGQVAMRLRAEGPSLCVSTACATGNHSIGEAWRAIRAGDADVIVAGGAEAGVLPPAVAGFMVMKALSRRNDAPEAASRPFDADRDGFVLGEGAGLLVLEELEHARARGAAVFAELVGYGLSNDAHHLTAPAPEGVGAQRCMRMALRSAGVSPESVGYVNAHGTSTAQNDTAETQALHAVFGEHARRLMVSSTKGVTGHLMGAAGGVEAIAAVMALREQRVPPTANWETRDPSCDLDYVPGAARDVSLDVVLSNAFGFGGTNATLVFRRFVG